MRRSLNQYKEVININVDLDAEDGRPSGRKSNEFRLVVRCVKKVNLTAVDAWLNGRMSFDISVLEALSK
jgi:eukaryotic translation initiation factor 2C